MSGYGSSASLLSMLCVHAPSLAGFRLASVGRVCQTKSDSPLTMAQVTTFVTRGHVSDLDVSPDGTLAVTCETLRF
jgi:hypothetical protein